MKIKLTANNKNKETKYYVERHHDFDAILEFARQKGMMIPCKDDPREDIYDFHNIDSVDQIIELGVKEGFFEFYNNNGICYRLTKKGVQKFEH